MKFKHIAIGYAILWLVIIAVLCIFEWNALADFQFSYEEENIRNEIIAEMKVTGEEAFASEKGETDGQGGKSGMYSFDIIADTSMKITVNGKECDASVKEVVKDEIYGDYSARTGVEISKNIYEVKAQDRNDIVVFDGAGNEIEAVENDYVAGTYYYDEELATVAITKFEHYLKHISGLVTLDELGAVMQRDSKAYNAVSNSQKSLEWMIKAKSMEFTKEEVTDMQIFDENHFVCDVYIELVKIPDTERERTVEEQVRYRVLYEKVNGSWYIYSFVTK